MNISAEISLYPLSDKYRTLIYDFIDTLKKTGLKVKVNGMSTQIFGEYEQVMSTLNQTLKPLFEQPEKVACIVKFLNSDRS